MDPIPSINRVFALISQEEKQQTLGGQFSTPQESLHGMAMFAKSDQPITKIREKSDLCVLIVRFLDIESTNAINSMVILLDISLDRRSLLLPPTLSPLNFHTSPQNNPW